MKLDMAAVLLSQSDAVERSRAGATSAGLALAAHLRSRHNLGTELACQGIDSLDKATLDALLPLAAPA